MLIAFDVKGTIEGPKKKQVLALFWHLRELGHECLVWSNSYSYAVDAVQDNALKAKAMTKAMKMDMGYDETQYVDFAIEDDIQQTWLAAKQFIWVHDLPDDIEMIKELAKKISENRYETVQDPGSDQKED